MAYRITWNIPFQEACKVYNIRVWHNKKKKELPRRHWWQKPGQERAKGTDERIEEKLIYDYGFNLILFMSYGGLILWEALPSSNWYPNVQSTAAHAWILDHFI
jgi:hypothetical protein